jgi:alpha-L-fucosidase 2
VTNPSSSPENTYKTDFNRFSFQDEFTGLKLTGTTICAGPTIDMQILRDLFDACIESARTLGVDEDFARQCEEVRDQLAPMQIGRYGQLQEWLDDWDDPEDHHRHVSHLYGLFPSAQISPWTTPKLAEAAKVSLRHRGDSGTGWAMAWKICLWARLHDGDHAYRLLRNQLQLVDSDTTNYFSGGTYANLMDAHPPFQIDGNLGACAGIAEMLLQSHLGEIELLPALPEAWPSGSVEGLLARGGYEVDISWRDGSLTRAEIVPRRDGACRIRYGQDVRIVPAHRGQKIVYEP